MNAGQVTFVVNLLQDINIHRPLVMLAAHELRLGTRFLVATPFRKRDQTGLWQQELVDIANATQSPIHDYENEYQALQFLQGDHGVLIAASESHLDAHKPVHDLFRIAPSQYLKITLQHGYECVGFLQSREQNLAHGPTINFAADIICGWCAQERLTAIAPTQRHKLRVTGSTALLALPHKKRNASFPTPDDEGCTGLVCENMHSPRLNVTGDFKTEFLDVFTAFSTQLAREGRQIALRPHPGGQYVIKNGVSLPDNVILENAPFYKIDLTRFAYGISAPSSILIDMVLAGIPTAVWQDRKNIIDMGNYKGLTTISTLDEWLSFVRDALDCPDYYINKQNTFLAHQRFLHDRKQVHQNFSALLSLGISTNKHNISRQHRKHSERVLIIAPGYLPTLQLSFIKPLAADMATGSMHIDVISEVQINAEIGKGDTISQEARRWLKNRIDEFCPTLVVFCRWAGPHTEWMLNYFSGRAIPTIFHLDDDLLAIPENIGISKYNFHNDKNRLDTVRLLLDRSDLVYASTIKLKQHLLALKTDSPIISGAIYCSSHPINMAVQRPVRKIGYMASADHAHNLLHILDALVGILRKYPDINFEFFGSIPAPAEFVEFGSRITHAPKIDNYEQFLQKFTEYQWDIGICPLSPIHFNLMKANTKWVEYTSVGAAVVASKGTVYDECCADGCGLLAKTADEWFIALDKLISTPEERFRQVVRAQKKLQKEYSVECLRRQVLDVFAHAKQLAGTHRHI